VQKQQSIRFTQKPVTPNLRPLYSVLFYQWYKSLLLSGLCSLLFLSVILASSATVAASTDNAQQVISRTISKNSADTTNIDEGCLDLDLTQWRHKTRSVIEARKEAQLQWVKMCRNKTYPVFGVKFAYDPQTKTDDFFHPLFWDLLEANGYWPYSIVSIGDNVAVHVYQEKKFELLVDYENLATVNTQNSASADPGATVEGPVVIGADDDPQAPLIAGKTQRVMLFDGSSLTSRWTGYRAHGGNYENHARLEGGALLIDVPEKAGWGKVGIYSEAPLVWLDQFGENAEITLTFKFNPTLTNGFALALATHYGLNGNDPSKPKFLLHWRKSKDGITKVTLVRDAKKVSEITPTGGMPSEVKFVITPAGIKTIAPGLSDESVPWDAIGPSQGFRIYAYSHPDEKHQPVQMALKEILLERKAGTLRTAQPADGVEALPVDLLFDGKPNEFWELASMAGEKFIQYCRFENDRLIVDVPAKKQQWGKTGLLSTQPVIRLDERVQLTSKRLTIKVDPKQSSGFQIMFHTKKVADMWGQHMKGAISLIRKTEGLDAGTHTFSLRQSNSPYSIWERNLDSNWLDQNWDGTLILELGDHWMTASIPGGPGVRGTALSITKGYELFMTVYSHPEKTYGASSLAVENIKSAWLPIDGMSSLDRWLLVDKQEFDPTRFLQDLGEVIPFPNAPLEWGEEE
jgi:hypothetical protein